MTGCPSRWSKWLSDSIESQSDDRPWRPPLSFLAIMTLWVWRPFVDFMLLCVCHFLFSMVCVDSELTFWLGVLTYTGLISVNLHINTGNAVARWVCVMICNKDQGIRKTCLDLNLNLRWVFSGSTATHHHWRCNNLGTLLKFCCKGCCKACCKGRDHHHHQIPEESAPVETTPKWIHPVKTSQSMLLFY